MGATSCWIPYGNGGEALQLVLACFGEAFPTALGIDGGYPANTSMYRMVRESNVEEWLARGEIPPTLEALSGTLEHLPQKCETLQHATDAFEHTWSGGGGFGDPLDRDPARVLADVVNDAVSERAAKEIYGVIVDGGSVDADATAKTRDEIRRRRLQAGAA
jgi:N-methylhydantoinase B